MNRRFYNIAFYLIMPLVLLRLLWMSVQQPAYARRWTERFGFIGRTLAGRSEQQWIWVHAVSVGETMAAEPLIRRLRAQHPEYGILITTMTPTGSERVRELFGEEVCHVYAPYDYSGAVKRFLGKVRPRLVILMETELWPNLVYYAKRSGAQVVVANARLSERSARGYNKFAGLGKPMLQQIDCIIAQAESDAARFRRLGVDPSRLHVTGSLKVEVSLPPEVDLRRRAARFQQMVAGERPIWIAASTRDGEEEKVLDALRRVQRDIPDVLLVLVPRHPERFDSVARLCQKSRFRTVRRSSEQRIDAITSVFLGDSMGEMIAYYGMADIAFVGGSLVDTGCQNVLEPAALGLPILTGPSQYNFQTICEQLQDGGALQQVPDEQALAGALVSLFRDPQRQRTMGESGMRVIQQNRGALERVHEVLRGYL
ncbi:MAG: lipid IV(A) 3-deoxy-D-manno-octulosonic acid transferase [Pseudohongiellaceae bacterium]